MSWYAAATMPEVGDRIMITVYEGDMMFHGC